jgi:DNA-binding LytR/AlgR family response regulator
MLKIGVVENEMVIADTICLTLKKLGYLACTPAPNYSKALNMINEEKPDLMLLDINLGGLKDGIDVAYYVREKCSIPIVFLTANSDSATIQRAKPVNPNAYLIKPFTKEDLYSAIEIAISNYQNHATDVKPQTLLIKSGYNIVKINVIDIQYIISDHNYVNIHLVGNKIIPCRFTLQEMLDQLPADTFEKVNRSSILNVSFITQLSPSKAFVDAIDFSITKPTHDVLLERMQQILATK